MFFFRLFFLPRFLPFLPLPPPFLSCCCVFIWLRPDLSGASLFCVCVCVCVRSVSHSGECDWWTGYWFPSPHPSYPTPPPSRSPLSSVAIFSLIRRFYGLNQSNHRSPGGNTHTRARAQKKTKKHRTHTNRIALTIVDKCVKKLDKFDSVGWVGREGGARLPPPPLWLNRFLLIRLVHEGNQSDGMLNPIKPGKNPVTAIKTP